jgi:hypothetical protein
MFKIGDKVQPIGWDFTPEACPTVKAVRVDGACQLDFRAFAGLPPPGVDLSEFGGIPIDEFWFSADELERL